MPIIYETRALGTMYERRVPIFIEPLTPAEEAERARILEKGFGDLHGGEIFDTALAMLDGEGIAIEGIEVRPMKDGRRAIRGNDYEVDGKADFAIRMIRQLGHIIAATELGDSDMAARWAFDLGVTVEMARAKGMHEATWRTGRKIRTAAALGHAAVHGSEARKEARWRKLAADVQRELDAGQPKMAAYSLVAERTGESEKTVRRAFKKICGQCRPLSNP